jgi:hypothetical protein
MTAEPIRVTVAACLDYDEKPDIPAISFTISSDSYTYRIYHHDRSNRCPVGRQRQLFLPGDIRTILRVILIGKLAG